MPTVDREGLAETLADALRDMGVEYPFTDADALIAGPLAPILAQADTAAQAVADRDEARAKIALWEANRLILLEEIEKQRLDLGKAVADELAATKVAQAEVARLSAEVEARDKRIAELSEAWADESGTVWSPPTAWAYATTCAALNKRSAEVERLRAALERYADPKLYAPHPHGLAFDDRDKSWIAWYALAAGQDKEGGKPSVPSTDAPAAAQEGKTLIARAEGGEHGQ